MISLMILVSSQLGTNSPARNAAYRLHGVNGHGKMIGTFSIVILLFSLCDAVIPAPSYFLQKI